MGDAMWSADSAAKELFTAFSTRQDVESAIEWRASMTSEWGPNIFDAPVDDIVTDIMSRIRSGAIRDAAHGDLQRIGVPYRFLDKKFENFEGLENLESKVGKISDWPMRWIEGKERWGLDSRSMALLWGSVGVGKTHLGAASARRFWETGKEARWISANSWIEDMKFRIQVGGYSQELIAAKKVPYLVLDELVLEDLTEWSKALVSELLRSRYDMELPTMVTTNNTPEAFGAFDERVASRLLGCDSLLVPLGGKDQRAPALTQESVVRRLQGE